MNNGLEFDPGFGPYILAFHGTVDYLYADINRFKNFSQRKMKFNMYYKKILDVFYNNLGFYIGCLMWAAYVKNQDEQPILNNHCLNKQYDEEEDTSETDFMIKFVELFSKDMQYFLGKNFTFEPGVIKILNTYKEFLVLNKSFVEIHKNSELKLPNNVNTTKIENCKEKIDEILKSGNLADLVKYSDLIIK